MIEPDIRIGKMPKIKLRAKNRRMFQAVAIDAQKEIRKRTESQGLDTEEKPFNPYSEGYEAYRRFTGRSTKPNLSFSGKMLGAMKPSSTGTEGRIRLGGEQGFKAWANERLGRRFFDLSVNQAKKIYKTIAKQIAKDNKLT